MGVTDYNIPLVVASPFVAALVFCLFLLIGRGVRGLYRWLARLLNRWIGPRAANGGRLDRWWPALTYLVVTGLLLQGFVNVMNSAFSLRDTTTAEGVHQPTTSLRSGGPGSLIPWDSLGRQGRNFIGKGPSVSDIEKFTHHPAMEPIRIYAGLASAADARGPGRPGGQGPRARGRFPAQGPARGDDDRQRLGRPGAGGHASSTSAAATARPWRSSTPTCRRGCPTWSTSRRPGRPAASCSTRSTAPGRSCRPDQRPRLFVAGESLGSFGGEAAFSGEYDLRNRTAGALFAGPPNFNTLFREFSDNRDAGSPEVQPVYKDGRIVRFANDPSTAIPPEGQPWDGSRVLYMMHPSDPIVWWSPHLIFSEPDWISEPPARTCSRPCSGCRS